MATTTEKVVYEYQSKTTGFTKNVKKANKTNESFLSSVGKWKVAGVAGAVGMTKMVYSASDLNESMNVVDSVFKGNAGTIVDWSKTAATSMGLSQTSALKTVGTFGAMADSLGLSEDATLTMATSLTELSADLASFYNISQDSAAGALKGIFTGETEALKGLGIVLNESTLKQYGYNKGMTEAEKIQVRYKAVMDQTTNAQGDFQKTSDGLANATRTMVELFKQLTTNIGQKLIPVFEKVIGIINDGLLIAIQLTSGELNDNFIVALEWLKQTLINLLPAIFGVAAIIVAMVGPMTIVGTIMGALVPIGTALAGAVAAIGGAVAALFSPVGLLIVVIGIFIGAVIQAGIISGAWTQMLSALSSMIGALIGVVTSLISFVVQMIVTFIQAVAANALFRAAADLVATGLSMLISAVANTVTIVLNAIKEFIEWAKQSAVVQAGIKALGNIVGFVAGVVGSFIGIVLQIIGQFISWINESGIIQLALTAIGTVIQGVITVISIILVSISEAINAFTNWVAESEFLQSALTFVADTVDTISDAIGWLSDQIAKAIGWFKDLASSASDALSSIPFIGGAFGGSSFALNAGQINPTVQSALNYRSGAFGGLGGTTNNSRSVTYNVYAQKVMSVMQAHREKVIFDQQGVNLI